MTDPWDDACCLSSAAVGRAEQQIRDAIARGEFDDLPGAGRPLPAEMLSRDEHWWIRQFAEREQTPGPWPRTPPRPRPPGSGGAVGFPDRTDGADAGPERAGHARAGHAYVGQDCAGRRTPWEQDPGGGGCTRGR